MRQRLVRAGERFGSRGEARRTTRGQLGTACDQYFTAGAENRLRAIGADRARRDEQIEDGADAERADQAYRHVALRRSEEHTSELQSLMRITDAACSLKNNRNPKYVKRKKIESIIGYNKTAT